MKKKLVMTVLLSSLVSVCVGIVIGMGIDQKNLFGTSAQVPVYQGNETFTVNGQTMDLQTLINVINTDRANNLENQIKDQMAQMQSRNELLLQANAVIASMKQSNVVTKEVFDFAVNNNIRLLNSEGNPVQINDSVSEDRMNYNIAQVRSLIDTLNSQSQLDMVRLQSLTNKRNEAFEIMTSFIQKINQTRDSIIGNMR